MVDSSEDSIGRREVVFKPTPRQAEFLSAGEDEVLFGGSAGGGKSVALLADSLRQIANGNYRALLLRRTVPRLREIVDRSRELIPRIARATYYEQPKEWRFSTGSKLVFGSCERDADVWQYAGHEYQWIGIDELGEFSTPYAWTFLTSRCRTSDDSLKCSMRATCNPGPEWIRERWNIPLDGASSINLIEKKHENGRVFRRSLRFIRARLSDNPYLGSEYESVLQLLPPRERAQLLEGRWDVVDIEGSILKDVLDEADSEGRIGSIPYVRGNPVSTSWDIGRSDATAIWCVQKVGEWHHVIDFYQNRGKDPDHYVKWLESRPYLYDLDYLPHDAARASSASSVTWQKILDDMGRRTRIVPRTGLEEGIAKMRMMFSRMKFDGDRCRLGLHFLRLYHRRDKSDGSPGDPVHDKASHPADALRSYAVGTELEIPPLKLPALKYPKLGVV